ncbi:MAG: hypothetical protein HQK91_14200 [Nitrospirae bacterium]|nr:hypothetical protein [Nitrospirota bacterium]
MTQILKESITKNVLPNFDATTGNVKGLIDAFDNLNEAFNTLKRIKRG